MKKNRENSGAERCWSPHIYQEIAGYSTRRQHNSASGSSKGKKQHWLWSINFVCAKSGYYFIKSVQVFKGNVDAF